MTLPWNDFFEFVVHRGSIEAVNNIGGTVRALAGDHEKNSTHGSGPLSISLLICYCAFPEPGHDGGHDDDGHDYPASDDQVIVISPISSATFPLDFVARALLSGE